MAKFRITNPKNAAGIVLSSDDKRFTKLVLDCTGGGMTEKDTALAIETGHELEALPVGQKITLSFDYLDHFDQRCRGMAVFTKVEG